MSVYNQTAGSTIADVFVRKHHHDIFYQHYIGISKVVFLPVRTHIKRILCETCLFIASAQAYAVRTGLG